MEGRYEGRGVSEVGQEGGGVMKMRRKEDYGGKYIMEGLKKYK